MAERVGCLALRPSPIHGILAACRGGRERFRWLYTRTFNVDATGPLEVFARTARWLMDQGRRREPAYTVELQ